MATYPEFTTVDVEGTGLVDELLRTVKLHIKEEFNSGRLTADNYTKVYLGSMESILSNATQYLLGNALLDEQRLKIEAEIAAIQAEVLLTNAKIDLTNAEKDRINTLLPIELQRLTNEAAKILKDGLLIDAEISKINYEVQYLLPAQKSLINAQTALANAQASLTAKQEDKIDQEILLAQQQISKIAQEILYLIEKTKTEAANTQFNFHGESVIGKQTALLEAQRKGFAGDLYAKIAKVHGDFEAVVKSVDVNENYQDLDGMAKTYTGNAATIAGQI